MIALLLRRLAASLLLLYLVLTATFFLIHLAPGDPALLLVGDRPSPLAVERLRAVYGLDRPLSEQYLTWLRSVVLEGDWGVSLLYGRPVVPLLAEALPATALLALAALFVQYAVGVPLGVAAARRAPSPARCGCSPPRAPRSSGCARSAPSPPPG